MTPDDAFKRSDSSHEQQAGARDHEGPAPSLPIFSAQLFGPFQIFRDDQQIGAANGLSRKSVRKLLKWFLLNPGLPFDSAFLTELLWPRSRSSAAANRLHVTLHYLRHLLEPPLTARQRSSFVRSDGRGKYWFDCRDRWQIDVVEVEMLRATGRAAEAGRDFDAATGAFERALEHYRRTFLPEDLFEDAFEPFRSAQEVAQQEVETALMRLYLALGQHDRALPVALSVLERDPCAEAASITAAEIRLIQGNVLAAHDQLHAYLQTVGRGLTGEPSPAVRHLLARIQRVR